MILPKSDMNTPAGASPDHVSQPPPSYVAQEVRSIDPVDKTPAFPTVPGPELGIGPTAIIPTHGTPTDSQTHYASSPNMPSGSSSASSNRGAWISTSSFNNIEVPAAFARAPPPQLSYDSFKPLFLVAHGKSLDKGFPPVPPPSVIHPHPFAYHDITEDDWLSFLNAMRAAATLTDKDISRANQIPIISHLPIVNTLTGMGLQMIMKGRKGNKVAKVVDRWNHHFFSPRKMRAILMKGVAKVSGLTEISADGQLATSSEYPTPSTPDDNVYRLFIVSL